MNRPKLEIITDSDGFTELYVNGKCIDGNIGASEVDLAAAVAEALGAEVVHADEPSRQPYTYFVTYVGTARRGPERVSYGHVWCHLEKAIEGPADTDSIAAAVKADRGDVDEVVITGFTCTDGPY